MVVDVYILPHERREALEAYDDWLTGDQVEQIKGAPENAPILLRRHLGVTTVQILEDLKQ